jgi:hypothetical protein
MHPSTIRGSAAVIAAAFFATTLPVAPAHADAKADCAAAYEASQEQKTSGKLREARKSLVTCSQAACPPFIKKDCSKWLSDVESSIPTVVFSAKAGSEDVTDVRVKMNDDVLTEQLDGKAVPMDPGTVTFVFESPKYGSKELKVVVKEGQKAQSIEVQFQAEKSGGGGGGEKGGETGGGDQGGKITEQDVKGNKTLAYVLAGVGVLGVGGFAYFGLTGKKDEDGLDCAKDKTCTDSQIDPIKKKYLYADISLGIGIVSLGVATYLFLSSPSKKEAPAEAKRTRPNFQFDLAPARGGGFASVSGAF